MRRGKSDQFQIHDDLPYSRFELMRERQACELSAGVFPILGEGRETDVLSEEKAAEISSTFKEAFVFQEISAILLRRDHVNSAPRNCSATDLGTWTSKYSGVGIQSRPAARRRRTSGVGSACKRAS